MCGFPSAMLCSSRAAWLCDGLRGGRASCAPHLWVHVLNVLCSATAERTGGSHQRPSSLDMPGDRSVPCWPPSGPSPLDISRGQGDLWRSEISRRLGAGLRLRAPTTKGRGLLGRRACGGPAGVRHISEYDGLVMSKPMRPGHAQGTALLCACASAHCT